MKSAKKGRLIASAMVLMLAACSERDGASAPANGAAAEIRVNVTATPALRQWLDDAAGTFNRAAPRTAAGKSIYVRVAYEEAGASASKADQTTRPDMWIPDNEAWAELADKRDGAAFAADCRSVATSPLVIAMWRPLAESLGWPARNLGWLDVSSLTADADAWAYYSGGQYGKTLRFAHTHPGLAGSGAGALLAVVHAARQSPDRLTVTQIDDPIVRASLNAFEGGVALFASDTESLGAALLQRGAAYLGAAVVYESTVLGATAQDDQIVIIHPYEGTVVATHPACINSAATADAREAAALFRAHLLSEPAQLSAMNAGLRPVNGVTQLSARFAAAQPKVVFQPPSLDVLEALQATWKVARKPVNLVLLIDVSGSMRGEKIERVRESAAQFVRQMGDDDFLTVIAFNSVPQVVVARERVAVVRGSAIAAINTLSAAGDTALFDSVAQAADSVAESASASRTNIIVVLSDGKDTSSKRHTMSPSLTSLAVQNDTSLFTIAYGQDAAADVMSELANKSNGSYFVGSVANIDEIYQEMSAAFGGNVGVGR